MSRKCVNKVVDTSALLKKMCFCLLNVDVYRIEWLVDKACRHPQHQQCFRLELYHQTMAKSTLSKLSAQTPVMLGVSTTLSPEFIRPSHVGLKRAISCRNLSCKELSCCQMSLKSEFGKPRQFTFSKKKDISFIENTADAGGVDHFSYKLSRHQF